MLFLTIIVAFIMTTAWYFLVRLHWIKQFQTVILMRSPPAYMALPHWRVMMWKKFWVWDDTEFLPDADCLRRE